MKRFHANRSRRLGLLSGRPVALRGALLGTILLAFPSLLAAFEFPSYRAQKILTPPPSSGSIDLQFDFEGKPLAIHLEPASVRSERFQVLEVGNGSKRASESPAPRTFRGTVEGYPESEVRFSRIPSGWEGRVDLGTTVVYVEPSDRTGKAGAAAEHWVYTRGEILEEPFTCLVGDEQKVDAQGKIYSQEVETEPKQAAPPGSVYIAEIAIDMDYEFFLQAGGTMEEAVAEVESILLAVNAVYERDVQVSHRITTLIVRDSENDPYNSSDGLRLLSEVENEWKTHHADVPCDVVHMFTGKSLNGGNAGYGYIGVICNDGSKFGFSKQTNSSFSVRTAVACHELGHNWNADHCNDMGGINFFAKCCDAPVFNMCSSLRGTPSEMFCDPVRRVIREHRDTRPCLEIGMPLPSPTPTAAAETPTPTPPLPTETPTPTPPLPTETPTLMDTASPTPTETSEPSATSTGTTVAGETATPTETSDATRLATPTPTQGSFDPDFDGDGKVDALDLLQGLRSHSLSLPRLFEFSMFWKQSL